MLRSSRGKSTARKPLTDISNGGKNPSRVCKKTAPVDGGSGDLDRLLLVRSDLSNLINEIDELVARALEHNAINRMGSRDIESFRNVLSDVHSSLKPWFPRLQQAFVDTPVAPEKHSDRPKEKGDAAPETEPDLIVSPSPLVSWRAGSCTVERGKQLFLLTPMPKPKALLSSKPGAGFPPLSIPRNTFTMERKAQSNALEANSQKSGCIPIASDGGDVNPAQGKDSKVSDNLEAVSASLASRYQELFGLQPTHDITSRRNDPDDTLDWFLSPPKTCILMEPSKEKRHPERSIDALQFPEPFNGALVATPVLKDLGSTVRRGKRAGESTLKKELWVKFEAASTSGLHLDASVFQKTSRKGFLDMLEEVTSESVDSDSSVVR